MKHWDWIGRSIGALLTATIAVMPLHDSDTNVAKKQIRHVVVLFQENVFFDHYFGTYPHALNPKGEQAFTPLAGTPKVEGYTLELLTRNPHYLTPQMVRALQSFSSGPRPGSADRTTAMEPSNRRLTEARWTCCRHQLVIPMDRVLLASILEFLQQVDLPWGTSMAIR
jgi:hypothetical protein